MFYRKHHENKQNSFFFCCLFFLLRGKGPKPNADINHFRLVLIVQYRLNFDLLIFSSQFPYNLVQDSLYKFFFIVSHTRGKVLCLCKQSEQDKIIFLSLPHTLTKISLISEAQTLNFLGSGVN